MRNFKIISDRGEAAFLLDKPTPYVFNNLKFTGPPEKLLLTTQAARQDGATLHRAHHEPRELELSGYVWGQDQAEMYKNLERLMMIIGGKTELRLEYYNDHGSYYIYGIVAEPPEDGERIQLTGQYKQISINFYCPDPTWKALKDDETAIIAYRRGRFRFPFACYPPGITFGGGGYRRDVINIGDSAAPIEIWIQGPAVQPTITNLTTGEFLAFNTVLQAYETIYINTAPLKKTVELHNTVTGNTEKILNRLQGVSDAYFAFWQLQPGVNDIRYDSGMDDSAAATVEIKWASAFTGV